MIDKIRRLAPPWPRPLFMEIRAWACFGVMVVLLVANRPVDIVDLTLGSLAGMWLVHAVWLHYRRLRPDDSVAAVNLALNALSKMMHKGTVYTLQVSPAEGGVEVDSHFHPGGDVSRTHIVRILRKTADSLEAEHVSSERLS